MEKSAKIVVDKMFAAFGSGDIEKIVETVSEDTIWVYHGTQVIPKATYKKKERARTFFSNILNFTEILHFEPKQFIVEDNTVVVLGYEKQKVKKSGKLLEQNWVQIYTVENG